MNPKPRIQPKPKRPFERNIVTIAAGVLCIEGLVMASDTKESYGPDSHTYVDKLVTVRRNDCIGAIAGCGEGYLLDYMTPHIEKLYGAGPKNADQFERELGRLMVDLYQSDAVKSYPADKASDLYTQFLVASKYSADAEISLFIVNSTLITKATKFGTIIGCGPIRQVAEELGLVSPFGIERAKEAAVCIVREAKRRYSDVGGTTQLVSLDNNNKLTIYDEDEQTMKESLLDRVRLLTNSITVSVLDQSMTPTRFTGYLQNINGRLRELHRVALHVQSPSTLAQRRTLRKLYKKGERQHLKRLASQKAEREQ